MAKRRDEHDVTKLPPGRADGTDSYAFTAQARGGRSAYIPDVDPAEEGGELRPYVSVWRAVLVQALQDAKSRSTKKENDYYRRQALAWLLGNSADFRTVCHFAGYEPGYVIRLVRQAQERGFVWRAGDGQQPTKHDLEAGRKADLFDPGLALDESPRKAKGRRHRFPVRHVQLELSL